MTQAANRQILLVEKPTGKLSPQNFKMVESPLPEAKDGEVLVRVRYISLDAANRAWMQGATYRAAVEANTVMAGGAIAEIVSSSAPGFAAGDLVFGDTGWQDYAAVRAKTLVKVPRIDPITHLLSVYGVAGLTAYFGLLHVGKPKEGETVVVSAAAGSVGSNVSADSIISSGSSENVFSPSQAQPTRSTDLANFDGSASSAGLAALLAGSARVAVRPQVDVPGSSWRGARMVATKCATMAPLSAHGAKS